MVAKFLIAFFVMTVLNTIVWQYVATDLYDCSDDNFPGYLEPGHWVHSWSGHPVAFVPRIVHGRPMSEPDTLKVGWTTSRLLFLWCSFFLASLVVSAAFARLFWKRTKRSNQLETTAIRS